MKTCQRCKRRYAFSPGACPACGGAVMEVSSRAEDVKRKLARKRKKAVDVEKLPHVASFLPSGLLVEALASQYKGKMQRLQKGVEVVIGKAREERREPMEEILLGEGSREGPIVTPDKEVPGLDFAEFINGVDPSSGRG